MDYIEMTFSIHLFNSYHIQKVKIVFLSSELATVLSRQIPPVSNGLGESQENCNRVSKLKKELKKTVIMLLFEKHNSSTAILTKL